MYSLFKVRLVKCDAVHRTTGTNQKKIGPNIIEKVKIIKKIGGKSLIKFPSL